MEESKHSDSVFLQWDCAENAKKNTKYPTLMRILSSAMIAAKLSNINGAWLNMVVYTCLKKYIVICEGEINHKSITIHKTASQ